MSTPTTRALDLLALLQARDELPGPELAQRLAVDPRTLRRHVARLQAMGVPVEALRGRHGGYRLKPGYRLPPMMFDDDEAVALQLGLLSARHLGLVASDAALASAQAKLDRVMPERLRRPLRGAREAVALDLSTTPTPVVGAWLLALGDAAHAHQGLQLRYRAAAGNTTDRPFDCYGLAWRGGQWYAVGHCHLRGALRSFRLDRIEALAPLPTRFTPPPSFDAVAHLAFSLASLPRARAVRVRLKTDLASARAALFDAIGVLEPAGRHVVLHGQADDLAWYARQLARLPFDFEVEAPPALRQALRRQAARLLRLAGG
jgi:predicted DNA-binding transcriptional regulator YafY